SGSGMSNSLNTIQPIVPALSLTVFGPSSKSTRTADPTGIQRRSAAALTAVDSSCSACQTSVMPPERQTAAASSRAALTRSGEMLGAARTVTITGEAAMLAAASASGRNIAPLDGSDPSQV